MLAYVILAVVYVLVTVPLAFAAWRALTRLSAGSRSSETYQGVATGCLVAVCAGLLLTKGIGLQGGILAWLAFSVACGLLTWLPPRSRPTDALACAVPPALSLLGTLLAVYLIPLWLGDVFGRVASTTDAVNVSVGRALSFTLFAALASVPAIAAAIIARSRLIGLAKSAYGADPKRLGRLEKVINAVIRVSTSVAAIFIAAR